MGDWGYFTPTIGGVITQLITYNYILGAHLAETWTIVKDNPRITSPNDCVVFFYFCDLGLSNVHNAYPACSMYGMFAYILHKFMPNAGKHSLHTLIWVL